MAEMIYLSELQCDVILELLNIGMGQAAASLSQIVGEEIKLSLPSLELLSRALAAEKLNNQARRIAVVKQHFQGPFSGDALLLFPQDKSLELVKILVKEELPFEMLMELEQDALLEMGNIILNSCFGTFGNMLSCEMCSELPIFMIDSAAELLGVTSAAQLNDIVMFLRMDFALKTKDIEGYIAFVLEIASIEQFKLNIDEYLAKI